MRRLYGDSLRQEAGVTKTFKGVASKNAHRAPPKVAKAVQEFQGTLERVYDDTAMAVEEFLKKCKLSCLSSAPNFAHTLVQLRPA